MAKLSALRGGKPGPAGCVTPATTSANAIKRVKRRVLSLGTGAVSTTTFAIAASEMGIKITEIKFYGQAAVTGTTITAEVFARDASGGAGNTLQSAAKDIKFATANGAKGGTTASLTATAANLTLVAGQLFEVVITASSITAGPGDLLVQITYVPVEDVPGTGGLTTTGADL